MSSETYHEPYEVLSEQTREMHRALWSLVEELQAIDWYAQRAEVTSDQELRAVLLHNREEEIEHAMMNLEWIRRNDPLFDTNVRAYLLQTIPITQIEQDKPLGKSSETNHDGRGLAIGSLKGR